MKKITQGQKTARESCDLHVCDWNIYKMKNCKSDNLYQQENLERIIKAITIIF